MIFLSHENELNWNNRFQVLYFYIPSYPFQKKLILMLDKVSQKYPNIQLFAIDVDYFKVLQKRFSVECVPTVLIMESGKEVKRVDELLSTSKFITIFDDICSM